MSLLGIHHITAIAGDAQRNVDFYTKLLGLRLVKRTVNFDDPSTYHLYFGDRAGSPGTIITFFPWPGARRGSRGNGQVVATSFAVPPEALSFWHERLREQKLSVERISRFDAEGLRLMDPDGLLLELIATSFPAADTAVSTEEDVDLVFQSAMPKEFAIRGFHAPTLQVQNSKATERLLTETLGFTQIAEKGSRRRFLFGRQDGPSPTTRSAASQLDLIERPDAPHGHVAVGTVHHIALRAADDNEQLQWREKLVDLGFNVTPVIDRQYFHSIYFREPGGILFEIATDGPGFAIDEATEHLGENLKLPEQFEAHRSEIERMLQPLKV